MQFGVFTNVGVSSDGQFFPNGSQRGQWCTNTVGGHVCGHVGGVGPSHADPSAPIHSQIVVERHRLDCHFEIDQIARSTVSLARETS